MQDKACDQSNNVTLDWPPWSPFFSGNSFLLSNAFIHELCGEHPTTLHDSLLKFILSIYSGMILNTHRLGASARNTENIVDVFVFRVKLHHEHK